MTEVLMWHSKKPRRLRLRGFSIADPYGLEAVGYRTGRKRMYQLLF